MPDESHSLVQLPGSERAPLAAARPACSAGLRRAGRGDAGAERRRAGLPADIVEGPTVLTHDELAERYGADPADVDLVRQTVTSLGLAVTEVHPASRRVKVAGTLGELASAFGATLEQVSSPGPGGQTVTHRYRVGPLSVPAALAGIVLAVLGLDTRPQARAHFRPRAAAAQGTRTRRTRWPTSTSSRPGPPAPGRRSRSSSSAAASPPAISTLTSAAWASRFPRSPRSAWTERPTRRVRIRPGPTWRSRWTSTSSAPRRPARRSSCISLPTPTRASSTRSPRPRGPPRRRSSSRSAGASPRTRGPPRDATPWTRRWPTRPRLASPCAWPPATTAAATRSATARRTWTSRRPARTRWAAAGPSSSRIRPPA